jgi:hypothetical protein
MNTLRMNAPDASMDKSARRISTAVVLALALLGAYLIGIDEKPFVPEATAKSVSDVLLSQDWQYFPDRFVNQGTDFEETYIEQF